MEKKEHEIVGVRSPHPREPGEPAPTTHPLTGARFFYTLTICPFGGTMSQIRILNCPREADIERDAILYIQGVKYEPMRFRVEKDGEQRIMMLFIHGYIPQDPDENDYAAVGMPPIEGRVILVFLHLTRDQSSASLDHAQDEQGQRINIWKLLAPIN